MLILIPAQLAAALTLQLQALQPWVPVYPVYQAVLVAPVGHACAPSYIWQRPGGVAMLGTQACPALQPPPIPVVEQKRPLVAQLGTAATGDPLGKHVPVTVGVNAPAMMPN